MFVTLAARIRGKAQPDGNAGRAGAEKKQHGVTAPKFRYSDP